MQTEKIRTICRLFYLLGTVKFMWNVFQKQNLFHRKEMCESIKT